MKEGPDGDSCCWWPPVGCRSNRCCCCCWCRDCFWAVREACGVAALLLLVLVLLRNCAVAVALLGVLLLLLATRAPGPRDGRKPSWEDDT